MITHTISFTSPTLSTITNLSTVGASVRTGECPAATAASILYYKETTLVRVKNHQKLEVKTS